MFIQHLFRVASTVSFLSLFILTAIGCKQSESTNAIKLVQQKLVVHGSEFIANVPENFILETVNLTLRQPRIIHFSGQRMFVGSKANTVYWLDPPYDQAHVLAKINNYPHSVVLRRGEIFIATTDAIYRAEYSLDSQGKPTPINSDQLKLFVHLPGGSGHNSRTLKQGPDGHLYVSLGIRGNCSDEYLDHSYPFDKKRGGIFMINEDTDPPLLEPFASGLRNPVGMGWHPMTKVLYASNNGPDHLGYEQPPEYFAKVTEGSFHGMPWYQYDGEKLYQDSCINSQAPQSMDQVSLPVATFPGRNAPLDLTFLTDNSQFDAWQGNAVVALHGSWATSNGTANGDPTSRRSPKLVMVRFNQGEAVDVVELLTGFQVKDGQRWARPAGIALGTDGALYFSSDAGAQGLYRLRRK